MAKTRPGKRDVVSIRGTNKVVRVNVHIRCCGKYRVMYACFSELDAMKFGDCVLMQSSESHSAPYVARVERINSDSLNNVRVRVRWYYRPEEAVGGRRQFHGIKELFLSDDYDMQSAQTIEGKCVVHTFKSYTNLENVGADDYFCRFQYKPITGDFVPDRVAVYCRSEMPYNPNDLMLQCCECKGWYHPGCVDLTIEQAKQLDHFICS